MEWLLGDEDMLSVELKYRLKRDKTFDSTVLKFLQGFPEHIFPG